jgi:hypothetical protein
LTVYEILVFSTRLVGLESHLFAAHTACLHAILASIHVAGNKPRQQSTTKAQAKGYQVSPGTVFIGAG